MLRNTEAVLPARLNYLRSCGQIVATGEDSPRQIAIEHSHPLVSLIKIRQLADLELHCVPVGAGPAPELRIVKRVWAGRDVARFRLLQKGFQDFRLGFVAQRDVLDEPVDVVDI